MENRKPCEGRKIKHPTFKLALRNMIATKTDNSDKSKANQDCAVYYCRECDAYHWGHAPMGHPTSINGITESIKHCDTVAQVSWVMSFYEVTIKTLVHSRNRKQREMGVKIMHLAAIKRKVLK